MALSVAATADVCVAELVAQDFRNYARARIAPAARLNVFTGPNGAGKTNILEAVAYLSLGASARAAHDSELVRWGAASFCLQASWTADAGQTTQRVSLRLEEGARKVLSIDGIRQRRLAALYGGLLVTTFTPEDLWVVKGPAASRRAWMDRVLVQCSPLYAEHLTRYRGALAERNAALRGLRAGRVARGVVSAWDGPLTEHGAELLRRREALLQEVQPHAAEAYAWLRRGREALSVRYLPGLGGASARGQGARADWRAALEEALGRTWAAQVAAGTTLCGPHRDDLEVQLGGQPARAFASQGQQRAVVLALKFAEREVVHRRCARRPVLLVDDVLSELDAPTRSLLGALLLREGQVWLTCADPAVAEELQPQAVFAVDGGAVAALGGASMNRGGGEG